jgi:putative peptidoglycan lipid II flippase
LSKRLLKSGIIVSGMTLVSRVLGLVRDVVIAHLIGAGAAADVFLFANRIPNFLRRLFAEGAFSQAFVPVLAEYQKSGDLSKTREFIGKVSGTLGGLVSIVTLLAMVGSPVVSAIFGMGWFTDWLNDGPDAHKFEQASLLLKITFPYLWFVTFVALSGAILNTIGKFGVMSFSLFLRLVQFELSTPQKTETLSHRESYGRIPLRPFVHKYSEKNQINGLLIIVSYR